MLGCAMKIIKILLLLCLSSTVLAGEQTAQNLTITDSDFDCVLDMKPVRGFYVDNLIAGKVEETQVAAALQQADPQ